MRTMNIRTIIPCLAILLAALPAGSPAQESERQAIAAIQKMAVSEVDSTLDPVPFGEWVKTLAGEKVALDWEVDDCGEQTGVPAIDKERDIPTCVAVSGILTDGRKFGIAIVTGTVQKGLFEKPALFDAYVQDHGVIKNARSLRDLPALLRGGAVR